MKYNVTLSLNPSPRERDFVATLRIVDVCYFVDVGVALAIQEVVQEYEI